MGCPVSFLSRVCRGEHSGCPASSATRQWGAQRVSAVLLLLLTPWLVIGLVGQVGRDQAAIAQWAGQAHIAAMFALALVIGFWHTAQGLQVIAEDYVPTPSLQRLTVRLVWLACGGFALLGLAAVAWLVFSP